MDEPENGRTCTSPVAMSTMLVSPDLVEQQIIDPAGAASAMSAVDDTSAAEIARIAGITIRARQSTERIRRALLRVSMCGSPPKRGCGPLCRSLPSCGRLQYADSCLHDLARYRVVLGEVRC